MKKCLIICAIIITLVSACVLKTKCFEFYPTHFGFLAADTCTGVINFVNPSMEMHSDKEAK